MYNRSISFKVSFLKPPHINDAIIDKQYYIILSSVDLVGLCQLYSVAIPWEI